ncbi:hypothetical protein H0H87_004230 [Tephrocybe sp. NHM501043]|nr:hypothetical protein H0H87_004230 [Tephrocybe sp. NHM501043]
MVLEFGKVEQRILLLLSASLLLSCRWETIIASVGAIPYAQVTFMHTDSISPPDRSPCLQARFTAEILSTSAEELSLSSPPYRPVASTSNLHEDLLLPSPAYYPPPDDHMSQEEKTLVSTPPEPSNDTEKPRPTVHYTDAHGNITPPAPAYARMESLDHISSRASTIATDEEDSEDYDWSGEEDLVDEEAKFEERMGVSKTKSQGWGIKKIIAFLFSSLVGSTFLAGILVLPGVLVQIYWYKPKPTEHRLYVKDNVQAWLFWAAANLVISWYLAMIVDVLPVIVQYFIAAAWGHVSEYIKTRIQIYDSLKNNVKPLLYAASGWVSWIIIFEHIYKLYNPDDGTTSRAKYTERLQDVVEFLFFFALVICAKQMLSHIIAFLFHRTAYRDRVSSVQEALNVIESLRKYRPKTKKSPGTRTPIFGSVSSPLSLSDKDHYQSLNSALQSASTPGTPPATYSKQRNSFYELEDLGTDADNEDHDRTFVHSSGKKGKKKDRLSWLHVGNKGKDKETSDLGHTSEHEFEPLPLSSRPVSPASTYQPESSSSHRYPPNPPTTDGHGSESTTLAHAAQLLKNAVLHDARNIKGKNIGDGSMAWNISSTQEAKRLARSIYTRFKDRKRTYLLPSDFYPAFPTEDAARVAFRVFDKDNNGDISRAEIKTCLVRVYKERRFLSRSMRDVGAALKTLDQILLLFAMIILFFISLSVFGVDVGSSLTSVYSLGIAASFIFKNSASSAFDSIMFLFVTHPYDTGDRCFIDQEILVVKKVGLFATVFARSDGSETYYFNSQLFTKFITNVRRSGDWDLRNKRKTAFHMAVNYYCRQLDITFYESTIPIVYADPQTNRYLPPGPSPPSSPAAPEPTSPLNVGEDPNAEQMKPLLGFLPPLATRSAHLRARRTKSRKAAMRGMAAD